MRDRVVAREQAGNWIVAAKHAALDSKNRDGIEHDATVVLDRPWPVGEAEFGYLHVHIGYSSDLRQRVIGAVTGGVSETARWAVSSWKLGQMLVFAVVLIF